MHELDSAEFARQVQVNLVGAHRMVAAVVPGMVARRRGDVVFVSSDVARTPRPRMGAYVAAKHGVDGMARAMQMELEGTGVRVSVVRPGPTMTGMGMSWEPQRSRRCSMTGSAGAWPGTRTSCGPTTWPPP